MPVAKGQRGNDLSEKNQRRDMDEMVMAGYDSPIGDMILGSCGDALCLCAFRSNNQFERIKLHLQRRGYTFSAPDDFVDTHGSSDVIALSKRQLDEYFSGVRKTFSIPLLLLGTTFQQSVWRALTDIPYGTTTTYRAVAKSVGRARSVRAAAAAIGANRLAVVLPCHRVIGSDGALTGYAGGLTAKQSLLRLEGVDA